MVEEKVAVEEQAEGVAFSFPFVKMHGLGNDFVVTTHDKLPANVDLSALSRWVSDRHFGVGADGLIVVTPPTDATQFDIQFVYWNSDGSLAEMCGNGIRCFARYVVDSGIMRQSSFRVETRAGLIIPQVHPNGTVTVDMGSPTLESEKVPFKLDGVSPSAYAKEVMVDVEGRTLPVSAVSMGNPHCLVFQEDMLTAFGSALDSAVFGPALELHPAFVNKTNVEFITMRDRRTMDLVVWERGCGFTLACGTGACASVVASVLSGKSDRNVSVHLPGGVLNIIWQAGDDGHVMMTGPATYAFEGEVAIPKTYLIKGFKPLR